MSCCAVIAVNALSCCKQRLAPALTPPQRQALVRLMLDDLVAALRAATSIAHIAVISPEPPPVLSNDIDWLPDAGGGLNAAAAQAANTLAARGIPELLLLHADLPLVTAGEIDHFVAAGRIRGLALAADRAGSGTNAIFLALPSHYEFCFGAHSLQRHQMQAARLGLTPALPVLPGLSFDVDTLGDLELLAGQDFPRYQFINNCTRISA
jgi:2-phospho-L-lactate guanylyltransferase